MGKHPARAPQGTPWSNPRRNRGPGTFGSAGLVRRVSGCSGPSRTVRACHGRWSARPGRPLTRRIYRQDGLGLKPESAEAVALLRGYASALLAHRITPHGLWIQPPQVAIRGEQLEVD